MKENTKKLISDLINRFHRNKEIYKNPKYNETQLRREFLDPFFSALGWDVANKQGFAEQYKEVVHEDSVKISGTTKAPDYSFRIGGVRKFFVEAKKPAVDIKYDIHPSYQLRRYAWSAKLPISILTDFEEFSVYDCRIKPNQKDNASIARIYYQTYDKYLQNLDFIYNTFSKESILKGSFDKYISTATKKKGTSEVDKEFLKEIERWRDALARNIALRNKVLSIFELNFVVQLTIDRIIFLRIAEDRGVEDYRNLYKLAEKKEIYKNLFNIFRIADDRYNSGIFNFQKDKISPNIYIDDKVLKSILLHLYYPESPYEFSVLPADILGNIYEQFLGKTIRLTPSHQAKIEEKPEVRKAGGVYYTPKYIVDYIVKNTIGEKIKGKTPRQISKITICDPACGSGSFLIQAYQYLLDYHLEYYQKASEKYKNKIIQIGENTFQLTTKEKKRILLNNIYGVDIDIQAVEVTKLSLLLKVLEGENRETLNQQLKLFNERALPNLSNSIKCGNSLIGTDFYDNVDMSLFGNDEMRKINAFDWEKEFPQVFCHRDTENAEKYNKNKKLSESVVDSGFNVWSEPTPSVHASTKLKHSKNGFDVVIGNPPYVEFKQLDKFTKNAIEKFYFSTKGKYDLFIPFIEKSIKLLSTNGVSSFIVPSMFTKRDFGQKIREFITNNVDVSEMVYFADFQVFTKVTNYPLIFIFEKIKRDKSKIKVFQNNLKLTHSEVEQYINNNKCDTNFSWYYVDSNRFTDKPWNLYSNESRNLKLKLDNLPDTKKLKVITKYIFEGIATGKDEVFFVTVKEIEDLKLEEEIVLPIFRGRDIHKYYSKWSGTYVIYPYNKITNKVIPENKLKEQYPNVYEYLQKNRYKLKGRRYFEKSNKIWYELWCERIFSKFQKEKIVCAEISPKNRFYFDINRFLGNTKTFNIVLKENYQDEYLYILGILNSKLMNFYHKMVSVPKAGGNYEYKTQFLNLYPIRLIDFSNPSEKQIHDTLVSLVNQMLSAQEQFHSAKIESDRKIYKQKIDILDRKIDKLVYELYDLTDEEKKIVEGMK
ncbi:MAG: N-6 DNA methylase [Candidatus Cloacimonetes bacterium]|nr:N-6 DNA methylase [Candidatus Cloacimonadota bacterium]